MTLPRSIVVYCYYGSAVYADGKLVGYVPIKGGGADTKDILELLEVRYEVRSVPWDQCPMPSNQLNKPPRELAVMEAHFARLAAEARVRRIAELRAELERLEG